MKQIDENDVCLYDGILLIVAEVEWDEAGLPTRWMMKEGLRLSKSEMRLRICDHTKGVKKNE